jgi:hypothetical protein
MRPPPIAPDGSSAGSRSVHQTSRGRRIGTATARDRNTILEPCFLLDSARIFPVLPMQSNQNSSTLASSIPEQFKSRTYSAPTSSPSYRQGVAVLEVLYFCFIFGNCPMGARCDFELELSSNPSKQVVHGMTANPKA